MTQWKTVLAQGALAGSLTSLLSSAVLALAYAALRRSPATLRAAPGAIASATTGAIPNAATSTVRCLPDTPLTRQHLPPGGLGHRRPASAEHRLSAGAVTGVYAALAIGVAAGALALRGQHSEEKKTGAGTQAGKEAQPLIRRVRAGHA